MLFEAKTLSLSDIDTKDHTFLITTEQNNEDLLLSIRSIGLINPPILIYKENRYAIVSGFRRIAAFRCLGNTEIPARILRAETSELKCAQYAISDNSFQRHLNLIEISRSINILSRNFDSIDEIADASSSLGLPTNISVIEKLKSLCGLPQEIQNAIQNGTISPETALDLSRFETDAGIAFAEMIDYLGMSLNKQREIITMIEEIARRDDIPVIDLLKKGEIAKIFEDENLDRNEKTRRIRTYLRKMRFPSIVLAEKNFNDLKRNIRLRPGINLMPPQNFEAPNYTLSISFHDMNELIDMKAEFERLVQNPHLVRFLGSSL